MLWHDGKIITGADALLSPHDRGVTLGDGLFETLPAFNGRPYLASAHLDRMSASAKKFALPFDDSIIMSALDTLANKDQAPAILRITLTRGKGQRGLAFPEPQEPTLFVTRSPWTSALAFGTARLHVSKIRRNSTSPSTSHKTLSYLDNVMAFAEARNHNADDALMLDLSLIHI